MPMNESAHACFVCELDAETLAWGETDARAPIGSGEAEDLGRPAIDFKRTRSGDETDERPRCRGCGARRNRQDRQDASGERGAEKTAARDGRAHGCLVSVMSPGCLCRTRVWTPASPVNLRGAMAVSVE